MPYKLAPFRLRERDRVRRSGKVSRRGVAWIGAGKSEETPGHFYFAQLGHYHFAATWFHFSLAPRPTTGYHVCDSIRQFAAIEAGHG